MKEIDKKGRESCFGGNKKEIDNKLRFITPGSRYIYKYIKNNSKKL
jgi:hypothetical protein